MRRRDAHLAPAIPAIFANLETKNSSNRKNRGLTSPELDLRMKKKDSAAKSNPIGKEALRETCSLTTEEWLDSVEAAAYLKVSLGALRNLTSNGQVPYYKMGKRNRYRTEELRQLLLSQKRGASNGN